MSDVQFISYDPLAAINNKLQVVAPGAPTVTEKDVRIELGNAVFNFAGKTELDLPPVELDQLRSENGLSTAAKLTVQTQKAFTAQATATLTRGMSFPTPISLPLTLPVFGNLTFAANPTLQLSEATAQMNSAQQTFSQQEQVDVPPQSVVTVSVMVTPNKVCIPFSATVRISGSEAKSTRGILNPFPQRGWCREPVPRHAGPECGLDRR